LNRQPILNRAAVVAVVGVAVAALKHYGVVIPDAESGAVVDLVTVGGPLVLAVWAARHVTPVKDPKAADGTPLMPVPAALTRATSPALVLVPAASVAPDAPVAVDATAIIPAVTATPAQDPADAAWAAFEAATKDANI
jgi:hypothetical protein